MVTVDAVVFTNNGNDKDTEVLLIKRKNNPYLGYWALPGGFIEMSETLEESIYRELKEETGIDNIKLARFNTYDDPGRDPRGRTITVAFWGMESKNKLWPSAGSDAESYKWFPVNHLPDMAFDHDKIIREAMVEANIDQL